jgi:hypothetical protein
MAGQPGFFDGDAGPRRHRQRCRGRRRLLLGSKPRSARPPRSEAAIPAEKAARQECRRTSPAAMPPALECDPASSMSWPLRSAGSASSCAPSAWCGPASKLLWTISPTTSLGLVWLNERVAQRDAESYDRQLRTINCRLTPPVPSGIASIELELSIWRFLKITGGALPWRVNLFNEVRHRVALPLQLGCRARFAATPPQLSRREFVRPDACAFGNMSFQLATSHLRRLPLHEDTGLYLDIRLANEIPKTVCCERL